MNMINVLAGAFIGALLGFIYYKVVGCATGTCPITSNPYTSSIYGGVMGILISTAI